MSGPADDRDEGNGGAVPPPANWVPIDPETPPADDWVIDPDSPAVPADAPTPADANVPPSEALEPPDWLSPPSWLSRGAEPPEDAVSGSPLADLPAPLTGAARVPWDDPEPTQSPAEPPTPDLPDPIFVAIREDPEPDAPGAVTEPDPEPAPALTREPTPAPAAPEPMSTAFETVTESTFAPAPEPAVTFMSEPPAAQSPTAEPTVKAASITAEHPEYLIAAALLAGFLLAKVVKKLAA
jgi:hypothetical protein